MRYAGSRSKAMETVKHMIGNQQIVRLIGKAGPVWNGAEITVQSTAGKVYTTREER